MAKKFGEALEIIVEKGGQLSDDTYVEKLISESARKLSAAEKPDELYTSWGLHQFVQEVLFRAQPNEQLKDLALSLLSR